MNGTYYPNPTFPGQEVEIPIYEENEILYNNKGKNIKIFTNINDNKEFQGRLEHIDKENVIINDIDKDKAYLIPIKYIYYIEFNESLNLKQI